jgi:N-acetylglucosaminyldiphosphoundecaprenol N-acetyl-beta-D-mannosaminyltransferase
VADRPQRTRRFLGVDFDAGTAAEILALAGSRPSTRARLVVTANLDHVVILSENPAFRRAYDGAAARTLDGMWLVWLVRLLGALAAPDLPARRIYLVCATREVGGFMAERLAGLGLPVGSLAMDVPPYGFEADEAYALDLAHRVRAHGTTLLILGVGAPRSEIWADRHATILGDPLVLAVGEALNVAAGTMPRAPVWMQEHGLEWFFRFLVSPRRLFARYFVRSWRILWIAWRMRAGRDSREPERRPARPDGTS